MTFEEAVLTQKSRLKLTWRQLAAQTGISIHSFRNWYNCSPVRPSLASAEPIAKALGLNYIGGEWKTVADE